MAEIFPTASLLRRALRELVPRDWFAVLDVQDAGEVIVPDLGGATALFSSPGAEISPSVLESFVQPLIALLVPVLDVKRNQRLLSSSGTDIDSWAYQFYGDFLVRRDGGATPGVEDESDEDFRRHIRCLIHNATTGIYFLPSPTIAGITAFLQCFGFSILIPPITDAGNLATDWYWWSETTPATVSKSLMERQPVALWHSDAGAASGTTFENVMAWDGFGIVVFVDERGEELDRVAEMLMRRAKAFGVGVRVIVAHGFFV